MMFFLIFLISFVSIFKVPESDLKTYFYYYDTLEGASFDKVLGDTFLSIREYEYFFKFYTWSVKNIFYQAWFYLFLSVFIIYHSIMNLTLKYLSSVFNHPAIRYHIFTILLWCILVAITFSTSTHLVRQYLAIAILSYAIVALINKGYLLFLFFAVFSVMTHYSMLVILLLFAVSLILKALFIKSKYFPFLVIVFSFMLSIVFGSIGMVNVFMAKANYSIGDGNDVSLLLMTMDLMIFFLFYYFYGKDNNGNMQIMLSFIVVYVGFLIVIHDYNYIFLRFYFVIDVIRSILGALIIVKINFTPRRVFVPVSVLLFSVYFLLRFYVSPWDYGISHLVV